MPAPITPAAPVAQPAAKPNGTPAPQTPAAPAAPAAPDLAQVLKERDEYKAKYEGIDKKLRVNTIEMKKFSDEKNGIGAKLSAHDKMAKALEAAGIAPEDLVHFRTNPWPTLKKALGDTFYDKLVEHRINGGTLSADEVVALVERGKTDVRTELEQKAKTEAEQRQQQAREADARAREQLAGEAVSFLDKSWAEYPVFEGYEKPVVAKAIAQFQEQLFHKTGKVVTAKEAADKLEELEVSRAERLAGIAKYQPKLTEKLKPANTSPVVGSRSAGNTQQERRTLSNDLTATTPQAKRAHRTDDERMAAIRALDLSKT